MTDQTTQTCRDCGETFPLHADHYAPSSKYANGYQSRCRQCLSEYRREQRRKREARMTDEEWREARERKLASQRRYREQNKDMLAEQRRLAKIKARLPDLVHEMRLLRSALDAADSDSKFAVSPSDEWRRWAQHMRAVVSEQCGGDRRRMLADPTLARIAEIEAVFTSSKYVARGGGVRQAYVDVVAEFEALSAEDINAALTHEPVERGQALDPSTRRALQRYIKAAERQLVDETDEDRAARAERARELLNTGPELNDDAYRAVGSQVAAVIEDAEKRGVPPWKVGGLIEEAFSTALAEAEYRIRMDEEFGASAREHQQLLDEKAERERKQAEARERRNAKRREQRAKAKRRRAQKAASARRRRAEGRRT